MDVEIIAADHHFYGVQLITMRKLFLSPVGFKVGMLLVRRDDDQAADKAIPMEDTDYLRVLRAVSNAWEKPVLDRGGTVVRSRRTIRCRPVNTTMIAKSTNAIAAPRPQSCCSNDAWYDR